MPQHPFLEAYDTIAVGMRTIGPNGVEEITEEIAPLVRESTVISANATFHAIQFADFMERAIDHWDELKKIVDGSREYLEKENAQ